MPQLVTTACAVWQAHLCQQLFWFLSNISERPSGGSSAASLPTAVHVTLDPRI